MYSIAIDLGGTVVKVGLIRDGKIAGFTLLEAFSERGVRPNLPLIKSAINDLLFKENVAQNELSGVGLAFPGLVNPINNTIISTNKKYDDARDLDFNEWVENNWRVPFFMDNDARLAVVGEWKYGAACGHKNVVMVTIGTGIGTGVIMDDSLLYGEHFQAGSLGGHFVVDYKARRCSCGNIGCVEALASSSFLPQIISENDALSPEFRERAVQYDFKKIFSLASEGETDAITVRNNCMDIWAAAIVTYIHAYDPNIIVLGGGIMKSKDLIIPYIKDRVDRLAWCPSGKVDIVASRLEDSAALLGIQYSLLKRLKMGEIN
ncbi:glucokinase [Arcticibacter tournemirensis]|uniref:ROK family protein n=2 Tax=Arcticibacter tournemirensis TaxID=699437 RepID=A0A5M9H8B1_9SPHI|nr:ROK family protein [Arcticibacter tournemirensis]TQM51936.1 glucokinase [Arcticibacter tournemirensis]